MEGGVHDLVVEGELPRELHGSLYRNGPNPQYAPRAAYHPFLGDGMIHALHLGDGRARYANRWVRTPRFGLERRHGESLFGGFAGPHDERAHGTPGGQANTNVVWHAGRLLALVEQGLPPVELDPETLATRGIVDFEGRLTGPMPDEVGLATGLRVGPERGWLPFTAHPKIDPETGEMLAFGYSVFAPELQYYVVSPEGGLVRKERIELPFASMVHDFVTTRDHVVFPIFPATMSLERAQESGDLLGWEPELGTRVGVMPRDGDSDDVVWLHTDPCYVFHPLNARSEGRHVVCEMARYPRLPIPAAGNPVRTLADVHATLVRWTLDLGSGTVKEEPLDDLPMEFPRIDERFAGLPYRVGFAAGGHDIVEGFRQVLRYDVTTGQRRAHDFGAGASVSEPVFVPRSQGAPEGDGFVLAWVYHRAERRSDLAVLDAGSPESPPLATVKLPHRVPSGFHGNWRPAG